MATKKKMKATPAVAIPAPTLHDVMKGFLAWRDADGAGPGTLASYGMECKLALREIGAETLLCDLTVERVQAYFECDCVLRTRANKPKAKSSIAKTRRVFRQALLWAQDEKLIEAAPLPKVIAASSVVVFPASVS
jgi:hypothetical protein